MATPSPFVLQSTLSFPTDEGVPPVSSEFGYSGVFESSSSSRLALTGVGTTSVPFGSVSSAKLILLEYAYEVGAPAVEVSLNGSTDTVELSSGGMLLLCSPSPVTGITSATLAHTAAATVRVTVLG